MSEEKPLFRLAQIYLVTATFGYRVDPLMLPPTTPIRPQKLFVSIALDGLNDGAAHQVRVLVRTTPEESDDTSALYDFAIEMAGLVEDVNRAALPDDQLSEIIATMIFPFVRETVASLTSKGRFGTVWLNPFDVRNAISSGKLAGSTERRGPAA